MRPWVALVVLLIGPIAFAIGLTENGAQLWRASDLWMGGTPPLPSHFGYGIASGDFDDDGYDALAVGVPGENLFPSSGANESVVAVIFGSSTGLTTTGNLYFDQSDVADFEEQGDRFGTDLVTGGFNGDGADDLAIGTPGDPESAQPVGAVNVIYSVSLCPNGVELGRKKPRFRLEDRRLHAMSISPAAGLGTSSGTISSPGACRRLARREGLRLPPRRMGHSLEEVVPIIASLWTGTRREIMAVNISHRGDLPNIAEGATVEVGAAVDGDGIHPEVMPPVVEPIAGYIAAQLPLQDGIVQSALSSDPEPALRALNEDPTSPDDEGAGRALFDEMAGLQADDPPYVAAA